MNILFVTPCLPYPPISGGRLQTFLRLRHLKMKGHGVFLLSLAEPKDCLCIPELRNIIDDVCCVYTGRDRTKIRRLFRKSLLYEIFSYDRNVGRNIRRFSEDKKIDIAVFEGLAVAQYRDHIPLIPAVLYEFNVEREIVEQLVSSVRLSPSKIWHKERDRTLRDIYLYLFGGREQKLVEDFESKAPGRFDLCLACSRRDRQMLRDRIDGARCIAIPWCVEEPSAVHRPRERNIYDLVFVGSMDWEPNRDAAIWFAKEIFPPAQRELKNIRFSIAGSSTSGEIQRLDNGNDILVKGFVPNIAEFLIEGDIFVAPIRYGGGVKVKVLEAMSHGLPVVATSKGTEGLNVRNGEHLFVADSPEEFVQSIKTLVNNRDMRLSMGMKGREYVSKCHGVDKIARLFERCLAGVVRGDSGRLAEDD